MLSLRSEGRRPSNSRSHEDVAQGVWAALAQDLEDPAIDSEIAQKQFWERLSLPPQNREQCVARWPAAVPSRSSDACFRVVMNKGAERDDAQSFFGGNVDIVVRFVSVVLFALLFWLLDF